MGNDLSYALAFLYGLIAFFTPCILPLLPVYFSYLTGEGLNELTNNDKNNKLKKKLIINAIGFVLGITVLNILLGFGVKALTNPLTNYSNILRIAGGILMILFGVYFISGIQILALEKERKIQYKGYSPKFIKSFILGITFSFGWTPCNGPIIASILILAGFEQNYLKAGTLMLTYSIGFSIMFIIAALLVSLFVEKVKGIYKYFKTIKVITGLIMIVMGILLITNKLNTLNIIQY